MRLILILLTYFLSINICFAEKTVSLCKKSEIKVFNCALKNKTASLCGFSNSKSQPDKLQYRFGKPSKLELSYPKKSEDAATNFLFSRTMYSGGGESRIHFTIGVYEYLVFERAIRTGFGDEGNNPEFSSGLVVKKSGKVISVKKCTNVDAAIRIPESIITSKEDFDYDINDYLD